MAEIDLVYSVGRVRALETKILSADDIARIAQAPDKAKLLAESGYGGADASDTAELLIKKEMSRVRREIFYLLPPGSAKVMILPYDSHNLKVLLKSNVITAKSAFKSAEKPTDAGYAYSVASGLLYDNTVYNTEIAAACARAGEFSLLSDIIASILNPLYDEGKLSTPFGISAACDLAFFSEMAQEIQTQPELIVSYFRLKIDFLNLMCILRASSTALSEEHLRMMLLPSGNIPPTLWTKLCKKSAEDIRFALEGYPSYDAIKNALQEETPDGAKNILDRALIEELEKGKYDNDTVVPVFLYFEKKKQEAKRLRRAFFGRESH